MSTLTTTARPYAKAIFEYALTHKNLAEWSYYLSTLETVVLTPLARQFIDNPASTDEQQVELLQTVIGNPKNPSVDKLIQLLTANKRLMVLPEIRQLYEAYKAEEEKTVTVEVRSFSALSKEQEQKMMKSLSQRLQRQVSLNVRIDPSLLGGAILHAGDLVIDGSILGKLHKLYAELNTQYI